MDWYSLLPDPNLVMALIFFDIGKDLKVVTEWKTSREVAKIIEEEFGERVIIKEVDDSKWKESRHSIPHFEPFWLNFEFWHAIYPDGNGRDVELSNKLVPGLTTVRSYIRAKGKSLISA
jgi:hypothetical protein